MFCWHSAGWCGVFNSLHALRLKINVPKRRPVLERITCVFCFRSRRHPLWLWRSFEEHCRSEWVWRKLSLGSWRLLGLCKLLLSGFPVISILLGFRGDITLESSESAQDGLDQGTISSANYGESPFELNRLVECMQFQRLFGNHFGVASFSQMGKSFVDSRKVTSSVNGKSMLVPAEKRIPKPKKVSSLLRAFFHLLPHPLFSCRGSDASLDNHTQQGNCVIGTLYGQRKGHVFLAIQDDPKCFPLFILELGTPTSSLVKEMASGLVRIALECEKTAGEGKLLLQESTWSMFCNGRKTGYATRRDCTEIDRHILTLVQAVSMGAGVLPMANEGFEGELMYMRARFERVIASADSESFYMMNPDGSEGPELSIFLMRA